ncbi:DUF1622 domain-containing protein (plasmid) [Cetobacterium somerae]|jgi:uncharacterized membrane protein|uniref:DUF1622 domain-containing protein n=1 Tax=Cetobacterium somerae TaxID=188913 RepID=UPI003D766ECE
MVAVEYEIMKIFNHFLHWLAFFFTVLSIGVICFGFLKSLKGVFNNKEKASYSKIIRDSFDKYILVGLQFLIIADIIDTIILRDLQNIIIVLLIVIIRTIMSWEIEKHKQH